MAKKKKIAIVTGATGGIGKEFIRVLMKEVLDEVWVIGRNKEQLARLKRQYGEKIIPICVDLTNTLQLLRSVQVG